MPLAFIQEQRVTAEDNKTIGSVALSPSEYIRIVCTGRTVTILASQNIIKLLQSCQSIARNLKRLSQYVGRFREK